MELASSPDAMTHAAPPRGSTSHWVSRGPANGPHYLQHLLTGQVVYGGEPPPDDGAMVEAVPTSHDEPRRSRPPKLLSWGKSNGRPEKNTPRTMERRRKSIAEMISRLRSPSRFSQTEGASCETAPSTAPVQAANTLRPVPSMSQDHVPDQDLHRHQSFARRLMSWLVGRPPFERQVTGLSLHPGTGSPLGLCSAQTVTSISATSVASEPPSVAPDFDAALSSLAASPVVAVPVVPPPPPALGTASALSVAWSASPLVGGLQSARLGGSPLCGLDSSRIITDEVWLEYTDDHGQPYYFSRALRISCWELPLGVSSRPGMEGDYNPDDDQLASTVPHPSLGKDSGWA